MKKGRYLSGYTSNKFVSINNLFNMVYDKNKFSNYNEIWKNVVTDKELLENSKIVKVQNDKLFVSVTHQVWSQVITMQKNVLINNFNKNLEKNKVKSIVCLVNNIEKKEEKPILLTEKDKKIIEFLNSLKIK